MRRGTRVGNAYVAVTADGSGINEEIAGEVDAAGDDVKKSGDKHGTDYGDEFGKALEGRLEPLMEKLGNTLSRRLSRRVGDGMKTMVNDSSAKSIGTRLGDNIGEAVADRVETHFVSLIDAMEAHLAKLRKSGGGSGGSGGGGTTTTPAAPGGDDGRPLGDILGSAFGRKSRNNFLHLVGSVVGTATKLLSGLGKAALSIGKAFTTGFQNAAEGAGFFQKTLSGLGGAGSAAFASLGKSGPIALGILAVALLAVGPLIVVFGTLLSGLLGIVVALSASIATALVGALGIAAAAFGAVAVAAGALTVAFTSMTDAQKALLSDAFRPLKAELVGLGQIMLRDMVPAFATWSQNLQVALALALPVAQVLGQAFATAGSTITAALSGPGFQKLAQMLGVYLPGIITRLASALGGFLNGAAGLFANLLPYVQRFAGWLDDVGQRFSRWANSAQGQNSIADFMDRALVAMKSVWGFAKELTGVITDLLFNPAAQNAGNNIFDDMTRGLQNLRRHIRNGDIEKWFKDAEKFAGKLGEAMKILGRAFERMHDSGALGAIGDLIIGLADAFEIMVAVGEKVVDFFQIDLVQVISGIVNPIWGLIQVVDELTGGLSNLLGLSSSVSNSLSASDILSDTGALSTGTGGGFIGPVFDPAYAAAQAAIDNLVNIGTNALNNTSEENGGWMREWKNPYIRWANSLIKDGPTVAQMIREAVRSVSKEIGAAIKSIGEMFSRDDVKATLATLSESINSTAQNLVDAAQQGLNSAASALAGASTPAEAQRALRAVHAAQAALANAIRQQKRLEGLSKTLRVQGRSNERRIDRLVRGLAVENATLADYAAARGRIAGQLERANAKLLEAINLRNQYRSQVTDAIKAFGALTSAQGKVVDGVEQALTAADITSNLQDRLDKIKHFQQSLQLLLAQGLSNAAYKQIVDAGVDTGSQFADALLAGGVGAIQNTNNLVGQVNDIANQLGVNASNRMYQAGVDAARGLVDGLESLSDRLDRAATRLGESIARAVRRALGIHSPSRVLMDDMDNVGDGAVMGLDRQHGKLQAASKRFSDQIAVSPEVASYAGRQPAPAVSGNQDDGRKFRDLVVHTPTEDPEAVAREVLNEVTGRL